MSKLIYSFIAPAIRSDRYEEFYDSVAKRNKVPFEVVFVGDSKPIKPMPSNFHYIYSPVKPSQCLEIAARNAQGELLICTGDDIRHGAYFLHKLDQYVNRLDLDKTFIAFRYSLCGKLKDVQLVFNISIPTSPIFGFGGVFRKDIWYRLGGIDQRFVYTGEVDVQMRFFEYGMIPFITPDCILNEDRKKGDFRLEKSIRNTCRGLIDSLWITKDGKISDKRLSPVEPFSDHKILKRSQGINTITEKGRTLKWK